MTFKRTLQSNGFKAHNNKSKELVASKFHSSIRNVRIVVNTGTDKNTGKPIAGKQAQFKAVYINNQSQWRTIATGSHFKPGAFKSEIPSKLIAIEAGAESASSCKCGAKKFKAKSGNVVCANACWANKGWSSKKKYEGTKKNTSQKPAHEGWTSALRPGQNPNRSRTPAEKKAIRAEILQTRKEEKKAQEKIDATKFTTFVPGQLVRIVEPQQNTLSEFIGTVTKVEPAATSPGGPRMSLLANVSVMWMSSGKTSRHNNYNSGTDTATYLVHA
jgi:hypothetical protein